MMSSWCSYELHVLASFHQEQLRSGGFPQDLTMSFYTNLHSIMCERTERWISNLPSTLLHSMHLKTKGIGVVPTFLLILSVELVQDLISNQERVIFRINRGKPLKTAKPDGTG